MARSTTKKLRSTGGTAGSPPAPLRRALDRLRERFGAAARLRFDPVELPRRYSDPGDAELVGLLASCLAYGRADLFRPQIERVLAAMGPRPARFASGFARRPDPARFASFYYRFNRCEDVAALVAAAGWMRNAHGSLGGRFTALYGEEQTGPAPLRVALQRFAEELRTAPPVAAILARRGMRGLRHLCPDPANAGACKRWNLYLRWMVRGPDEIDLGLWRGVPAAALLVPLDTHIRRIARYLSFTDREDMSWRTAAEITRSLAAIDPGDPVRFDFALCHLGMSGACPPKRDPAKCAACLLAPHCRAKAPGV